MLGWSQVLGVKSLVKTTTILTPSLSSPLTMLDPIKPAAKRFDEAFSTGYNELIADKVG
jgi:hypothetical protein